MTEIHLPGIAWPGDSWPASDEAEGPRIRLRGVSQAIRGEVWTGEGVLRMGRSPGLEMSVEASLMSRCHAELRFSRRGWLLRDLDSTNGTYLNRRRIGTLTNEGEEAPWHRVRPGDIIGMGESLVGVCFLRFDGCIQLWRLAEDIATRFDACRSTVHLEWVRKGDLIPACQHPYARGPRDDSPVDAGRAFTEGRVRTLDTATEAIVARGDVMDPRLLGSHLYLPLRAGAEPVAVVELFRSFMKRPFGEEECREANELFGWDLEAQDVFDNPIVSRTVEPLCRNRTVLGLAETIRREGAFADLPILGDALEEYGCTDEEILAHCRGNVHHVERCWVLDLLLGREWPDHMT